MKRLTSSSEKSLPFAGSTSDTVPSVFIHCAIDLFPRLQNVANEEQGGLDAAPDLVQVRVIGLRLKERLESLHALLNGQVFVQVAQHVFGGLAGLVRLALGAALRGRNNEHVLERFVQCFGAFGKCLPGLCTNHDFTFAAFAARVFAARSFASRTSTSRKASAMLGASLARARLSARSPSSRVRKSRPFQYADHLPAMFTSIRYFILCALHVRAWFVSVGRVCLISQPGTTTAETLARFGKLGGWVRLPLANTDGRSIHGTRDPAPAVLSFGLANRFYSNVRTPIMKITPQISPSSNSAIGLHLAEHSFDPFVRKPKPVPQRFAGHGVEVFDAYSRHAVVEYLADHRTIFAGFGYVTIDAHYQHVADFQFACVHFSPRALWRFVFFGLPHRARRSHRTCDPACAGFRLIVNLARTADIDRVCDLALDVERQAIALDAQRLVQLEFFDHGLPVTARPDL